MNNKLLLVTAITLLYRESQLPPNSSDSRELVRKVLQTVKPQELSVGFDHTQDIISSLKDTVIYMCDTPQNFTYELADFLQRIKINTLDEEGLYEAIEDGISPILSIESLKRTCLNLSRDLELHFKEGAVSKAIGEAAYKFKFQRDSIPDLKSFISGLTTSLEPFMVGNYVKDPAIISEVDISDLSGVASVCRDIKKSIIGTGVLKTGYQGVNRMLDGGFRRGESAVIGALQHNYKTGFSLGLFKQIALYNIPELTDKTKKPLLVRISFEDNLTLNFQFLYTSLVYNETGIMPDIENISVEEMSVYIHNKLSVNGYEVKFLFVNPSLWTYKDICNKMLEYEAEGYEVHMCMLDYLIKVPTTGCDQGAMGNDVLNMYERCRNFMAAHNIAFVTPHQLSTDAKMMIREGRTDFVRELPGKGFYMKSKQIDQIVDLEIFIHIEIVNGVSYLTVQRGKHRKTEQTPVEHLYCVLKFVNNVGILDDLNKPDSTLKRVGGGPVGSGEEVPFWCENDMK